MARKKLGRRYTPEQKQEVLRRVQGGESHVSIAKESGISAWTIGQWAKKARGGAKVGRRPGRPRASASPRGSRQVAWTLEGDVLVVRVPLRQFARQLAQKALAKI